MSDYTKKFTVVIKKDGYIKSVVNVIGTFEEVESMAHDILDDEGYTFDIIKDQDVFDIVYHFEDILEKISGDAYILWNKTRNANEFKSDFEDYKQ